MDLFRHHASNVLIILDNCDSFVIGMSPPASPQILRRDERMSPPTSLLRYFVDVFLSGLPELLVRLT